MFFIFFLIFILTFNSFCLSLNIRLPPLPPQIEGICRGIPQSKHLERGKGDGGFRVTFEEMTFPGDPPSKSKIQDKLFYYNPSKTYRVGIVAKQRESLNGFIFTSVRSGSSQHIGQLIHFHPSLSKPLPFCPHVASHPNLKSKKYVYFKWVPPKNNFPCVDFKATVISKFWFKDEGELTMTVCPEKEVLTAPKKKNEEQKEDEEMEKVENSSFPPCCACGSAKYEILFEGLWSPKTHPKDYPTDHPRLLHWSNVVGASHTSQYEIWKFGGYSTKGVKDVCELGYTRNLENEIEKQSKKVRTKVRTSGIWYKEGMGIVQNRSARFTTDRKRNLFSLISMVGPSPDWCVGVSNVDMCFPNCTWSEGFQVDLLPWDAGTDDGVTYMSHNKISDPQQRIRNITSKWPNDPKSPFYDLDPIPPLARLYVKKLGPSPKPPEGGMCEEEDTSDVDFLGLGGEGDSDQNNVNPRCMVSDWDDWSSCSVTCGVGTRTRRRMMKDISVNPSECNLNLKETENCIGVENECESIDEDCSVTSWSQWSPCSVTCGSGVREKRRFYMNSEDEKRCKRELLFVEVCTGIMADCSMVKKDPEICNKPKFEGPCRGNFEKFYFDTQMQKCLPFNYGGCRGNENRFDTEEECSDLCLNQDKSFCMEPSDPGTCGKKQDKWYFDKNMSKCLPFTYSGCEGNRNRFDSMEQCSDTCQLVTSSPLDEDPVKRCQQPSSVGSCGKVLERWYFDTQMRKCLPFEFGGCQGNSNNFETMDECTEFCTLNSQVQETLIQNSVNQKYLQMAYNSSNGHVARYKPFCALGKEKGPCNLDQEKWYFDIHSLECLSFQYGGCSGNANNFETKQLCMETCMNHYEDTSLLHHIHEVRGEITTPQPVSMPTKCYLRPEPGFCKGLNRNWYFDTLLKNCLPFEFTGCGGNENNFISKEKCVEECERHQRKNPHQTSQQTESEYYKNYKPYNLFSNDFSTPEPTKTPKNSLKASCLFPKDMGPCRGSFKRWHYNQDKNKCVSFIYGGCLGNENNFKRLSDCEEMCGGENQLPLNNINIQQPVTSSDFQAEEPSNPCLQPPKRGHCRQNLERWHFDFNKGECLPFQFSGCGENQNNFKDMYSCIDACGKEKKERRGKKMNCKMSQWTDWSECSVTCGKGYRMKTRMVEREPSNGGKKCSSLLMRKQKCMQPPCKEECSFKPWSAWSECSKTCGRGLRRRIQTPLTKHNPNCSAKRQTEICSSVPCQ